MLESMKLTTHSTKNRSGYFDLLSYVQTDATTPNIVCWANNAWSCCVRIGSGVPALLRYASVITERKKSWEVLAQKFDRF